MKKLIILSFAMLPLIGFGQNSPQRFTLKDAISYGLKNHGSVRISENEKLIADQKARQSLASVLPQINATGTLDDNLKRQVSVLPAGIFGPEETKVQFGTKFSSTVGAELSQPVYDQALLTGLKANKPYRELANLNAQQNQENLIYNITEAYYQILISQTQLKLLENNLEIFTKMHQVLQLQVNKGVQPRVELDKVNVNLNNTQSQITSTQSTIRLATNTLKYHMGWQADSTDILVSDLDLTQRTELSLPEQTPFNYRLQTNYRIQQTQIGLREIDAKRIQAGALPKVSIYGRYGTQAVNNSMGELYRSLNDYSAIGLKISIPVFDGFSRQSQVKQVRLEIRNNQENLKLNEALARVQYQNATTQLNQSQLILENNRRNIELAEKVMATSQLQYGKGVILFSDLLSAQQSLKEAQTTYVSNLLKYFQSKLDVEKANGTLLSFYQALN